MSDFQDLLKGKTPVTVLQEICSKRKLTPNYDVLATEGPVHEPVFVMRAQAGEFQGTGKGPSKKKAKHNAASMLLCCMHDIKYVPEEEAMTCESMPNGKAEVTSNGISEPTVSAGAYDGDVQGNPIGELQEYTQKNLLRPPVYEFIGEQGPPHAREFVCTVKLAKLQETAVGKSKKVAKRAAASKLLQSVQQIQNDTTSTAMLDEDEEELPLQSGMRGTNIAVLTSEGAKQATHFFNDLKNSSKTPGAMQAIHSADLNSAQNFPKLLEELAKERKIDIRYLDIKERSHSGQHQCLVQISTAPIAVCHGSGLTTADAHTCAAHNALQYLKIMTAES